MKSIHRAAGACLPRSSSAVAALVCLIMATGPIGHAQFVLLQEFYRELALRDFTPGETSFVDPILSELPGQKIAGNQSCRECHAEDSQLWDSSKHAHAWHSLRREGTHVDPACQRCHATGYGLRGGFESVAESSQSVNVGCESCHGPSREHVKDPKVRTPHYTRAGDYCISCHDLENSPQFVYDTYWAQIRHGTPPHVAHTSNKTGEDRP